MLGHAGRDLEALVAADEPIEEGTDQDSAQNGGSVVHRRRCDGQNDREGEENDHEDSKRQAGDVDGDAPNTETEGTIGRVSAL